MQNEIKFECLCKRPGFGLWGCPFHMLVDVSEKMVRLRYRHENDPRQVGHIFLSASGAREMAAYLLAMAEVLPDES